MTTEHRNFLGLTVEGDITQGSTRVEQRPVEDLQPTLQAVLDDPTILEFGWRQYTPYFNDGEPCKFSIYGLWVRTNTDEDTDDLNLDSGHPSLGEEPYIEVADPSRAGGRTWKKGPYQGPDQARYERCHALRRAIEGGEFENVLLAAFGDHAAVTVRRDGIQVDFYEHD